MIKKQFRVTHEDNIFIQADYKQAEGRVIATLAQDDYLREIFANPDIDMFNELSDSLYGTGNWTKEDRVRTKAFFYGLSYGREAFSIALEYNMTVREAEKRLRDFMDLIPATAKWQEQTKRRVLSGEDLVTPFGRKRRFYLITDENRKDVLNEALSYLPQSTASDICLSALIRLRPMLRGMGWIRLTVHDALVVECPERYRDTVSTLLQESMLEEGRRFTDYVPFAVDLSYGKTYGDL
jgi:DNA polymerase I-like protein with 3'-5' exonuclease and polymerase domains